MVQLGRCDLMQRVQLRTCAADDGDAPTTLLSEIFGDAKDCDLLRVNSICDEDARHLLQSETDERLAPSCAFFTMLSFAVCGRSPQLTSTWSDCVRSRGLKSAAMSKREVLYEFDGDAIHA